MTRWISSVGWIVLSALAISVPACNPNSLSWLPTKGGSATATETIPPPINLMLPRTMEIHPFTQTAEFGPDDCGIHARITARDADGDETKAYGDFRFELYIFRPQHSSKKGPRIAQWEVSINDPEQNLMHWDRHTRSYEFKLGGFPSIAKGTRLILVAVFSSRFTPRIDTEREITAGQ